MSPKKIIEQSLKINKFIFLKDKKYIQCINSDYFIPPIFDIEGKIILSLLGQHFGTKIIKKFFDQNIPICDFVCYKIKFT